jgi:hypothetical protein
MKSAVKMLYSKWNLWILFVREIDKNICRMSLRGLWKG